MQSDATLTPDMSTEYSDSLNFIDNHEYNTKIIEMMADPDVVVDSEVGQWYFSSSNQLEIEFEET